MTMYFGSLTTTFATMKPNAEAVLALAEGCKIHRKGERIAITADGIEENCWPVMNAHLGIEIIRGVEGFEDFDEEEDLHLDEILPNLLIDRLYAEGLIMCAHDESPTTEIMLCEPGNKIVEVKLRNPSAKKALSEASKNWAR